MHTWYYSFFIGLAGSWHCLIMCGPIVSSIKSKGHSSIRMILYPLGRIFMYGIMGYLVAGIGSIWLFPSWWYVYYIAAGILIFLNMTQKMCDGQLLFLHESVGKYLRKKGLEFGHFGYFMAGMANGLMPCGLVLAGLSIAILQPNPYLGFLSMVTFGVATLPALQIYVWGIKKINLKPLIYLGWAISILLIIRGTWGIGMNHSNYLRHSQINPIICHPFSK
jgi:sulfite exporter TauE/SafE